MPGPLPPTVKSLGLVSLLTDASSEMIYPLLPSFVTGVLHGSPAFLGVIEGAAETVAALMKVASGWWSDRVRRRKPVVVAGYGLSTVARPLVALARAPWHVLVVRVTDRVGKGVRSAPRDALLAQVTLGNSSDAFLLLRAQQLGVSLTWIPILWSYHHVVKSALSTAGGGFSDRVGRRRAIALGWGVYALSYAGFALAASALH